MKIKENTQYFSYVTDSWEKALFSLDLLHWLLKQVGRQDDYLSVIFVLYFGASIGV